MKAAIVVSAMLVMGVAGPASADMQTQIKPGLWEFVTKVKMPGMSAAMPALSSRQCLTAKEIARRERQLVHPPSNGIGVKCETRDFVRKGNTTTWKMNCTGEQGTSQGVGKVVYDSPTAYHGTLQVNARMQGQSLNMTQHITARRTGACRQ